MTNATPLLDLYQSLGIEITANGDKLRLNGLESALTPEIQIEIRNQRVCIFSELSIYNEKLSRCKQMSSLVGYTCSESFEQVGLGEQGVMNSDNPKLTPWLTRATECNTLSELENMLKEFCQGTWTILDRAALSNAYTLVALKLIERENASKAIMLEHLASLVWKSI